MKLVEFTKHPAYPDSLVYVSEKEVESLDGLTIWDIYELNVCTKWGCNTRYIYAYELDGYRKSSKTGHIEYDIIALHKGIIT